MDNLLEKTKFEISDIIKILPHRYPFILIDRIEIIKSGESLIALKNVTINEPFFQGHFPGEPIMPGVLSLEVLCQAGSFLMLNQVDDPLSKNMFFTTVEKARFKRPIRPGDQLQIEVELVKVTVTALVIAPVELFIASTIGTDWKLVPAIVIEVFVVGGIVKLWPEL